MGTLGLKPLCDRDITICCSRCRAEGPSRVAGEGGIGRQGGDGPLLRTTLKASSQAKRCRGSSLKGRESCNGGERKEFHFGIQAGGR